MAVHRVSFSFKGRYFDNDVDAQDASGLCIAIHGYGQLAEYFIRKFDVLRDLNIRIVAPEGLSRYYLSGSSGRVGASWMTREDRLTDIDNYLRFLNTLYESEIQSLKDSATISALGFSQGAATVSRWISQPGIKFDRLILWAGLFPPDLDLQESRRQLKGKDVQFVYGKQDPYLSDERFKEQNEIAAELEVTPVVTAFDGRHTIDGPTLAKLFTS